MVSVVRTVILTVAVSAGPLFAQSSAITETARSFSFSLQGNDITISRNGSSCPGSCVQPMQISPGVMTLGELEVIAFLQNAVSSGAGLLVDVRKPEAFATGSVPGAVNVPVATFARDNPYLSDLLSALGVRNASDRPSFDSAFSLVVFGNGSDDKDAPAAIANLLNSGYPADKIQYYRGGFSDWETLGLTQAVQR